MLRKLRLSAEGSITEGVIWKPLLSFFFPILLGTFFQQLYNTVDAMIVGKYVGKEALAAVGGATGTMINLIVGFFLGLSSGASVIISQFYGARRDKDVNDTVHTAMALALVGGAVLTVVGYSLSPSLLRMMGTPEDVMGYATDYISIYFLGTIPSMIFNIGSGILRAVGNSRRPLMFLVSACFVNIILDVIFVMGFDMGTAGAAIATVLSQSVCSVLVLTTLCRSSMSYRLELRRIRFHGALLRRTVQIGLPAGLQSVMYSLSNVIIQAAVNGFGTDVLAAWTAYGKMDGLFWMTISAFGVAITTFAGQNFGAQRYDRMRRSVRVCLAIAAGTTLGMSTILLLGRPLLSLFASDAQVLDIGMTIVRTLVPTYITYLCIEILSGAVRGAGDSVLPTLMTLFGVCILRVIWVMGVCPPFNSMFMVILSYPITWIITSLMFILYYWKAPWLKRCIRKAGFSEPA